MAAWVRSNWIRTIPVVLVVALAAGVAGALAVGTRRTETAPDRYTAAYGGDPIVALYQPYGPPLTDVISTAPGVDEAVGITFVTAFPVDSSGNNVFDSNPFAGEDDFFGARVVEGRFTAPGATNEFTVNLTEQDLLGGEVGETYDFVSYSQQQTDENDINESSSFDGPTFRATLVGIVTSSAEFEDSTPTLTLSDGFLPAHPGVGTVATIRGVRADPGSSVDTVMANVREATAGAELFQIESRVVAARARDAVDLHTRSLWVVTLVTLLAAVLITAQVVGRHLRATTGDREALLALGYRPRQIAIEAALKGAGVGAISAGIATAVATVGSALFPLGAVRTFEPDPGPTVDLAVLAVGAIGLVVLAAASAAVSASRVETSRNRSRVARVPLADGLADLGAGPTIVSGVRFALARPTRRGVPPLAIAAGLAVSLSALLGALVVGTSLVRLTTDPDRRGQNYDQLFGNPFLPATRDIVTPILGVADFVSITAATTGSLTIQGEDVAVFAYESVRGDLAPTTTSGRLPVADDEIQLGRRVARRLDVAVGDTVTVDRPDGSSTDLRVVGFSVSPDDAGDGAVMAYGGYAKLVPDATQNLVLVRYPEGVDGEEVARRNADSGLSFSPPDALDVSTTVRALERVIPAPFTLVIVLALLIGAMLAQHFATSVRERSHSLSVLHALGSSRRQLRGLIHWQATTLALIGLMVSVPFGAVLGGRIFTLIANNAGLVSDPLISPAMLGAFVVGVLLLANFAALWPSHRASSIDATELLRGS